jgi:dTDP-glucose 4,6-dehydratase
MAAVFSEHRPRAVYHLAAESHVDRSIDTPRLCIETNILGTATLLETALDYWRGLDAAARGQFRLLQVSDLVGFGTRLLRLPA